MPRKYLDTILFLIFATFFSLIFKEKIHKAFFFKHQVAIGQIKIIGKESLRKEKNSTEFDFIKSKKDKLILFDQDVIQTGVGSKAIITVGSLVELKINEKSEFEFLRLENNNYEIKINKGTAVGTLEESNFETKINKKRKLIFSAGNKRVTVKPLFIKKGEKKVEFKIISKSQIEFNIEVVTGFLIVNEESTLNGQEKVSSSEIIMEPNDLYPSEELSLKSKPCTFISPKENEITEWLNEWGSYQLQWMKEGNCTDFLAEVSKSDNFDKVYWSNKTTEQVISIEPPNEKFFYWRIIGFTKAQKEVGVSKVVKVVRQKLLPPIISNPKVGQIIFLKKKKKNIKVFGDWHSELDTEYYEYELAKDVEFKNLVKTEHIKLPQVLFRELGAGTYYFRVKSKNSNRPDTPWSEIVDFKVQ